MKSGGEIYMLSDKNRKLFIPNAINMVENLGWSVNQVNDFLSRQSGLCKNVMLGRGVLKIIT